MNLRQALLDADLRALLMSVFHLSGDRRFLAPPFLPARDVRLIADEDAGLSPEAAAELREAALALAEAPPAITDPGDALMGEMMSVALGEAVAPEYAPMMREELGFRSRDVEWREAARWEDRPVLVVGAGASGIAMAVRLERLGIPYTVVEKGSAVGGVWRENRYPGCGVDTPNHAYSYSFAKPNRWSRFFAPQSEIEGYLQRTAEEHGIVANIEFGTAVVEAAWSETERCWEVVTESARGSERRRYAALISAIGQLNEPSIPGIPGLDRFAGPCFHSSRWPEDLAIDGKRVAVLGTGASAMQIVPSIVDRVAGLTVYQRSPQWARPIPRYHEPIPPGSQWLFEHMPFYAEWFRLTMFWRYGDGLLPLLRKDPEWPHPERSINRSNERHREQMAAYMASELAGRPDLYQACLPSYPPYGKRILLDNGWFRALRQPKVELVGEAVARVGEHGLFSADGQQRPCDVLVLATGFRVTEMAARLNLRGRSGVSLRERWKDDDPRAHLGITVPGFPNFFCMQGPNTGLGHGGSAIFQSECQARYISGCLVEMAQRGIAALEVREEVHDAYVARVDAEHEKLVWTHPGMRTYYRNGRGRVVSVMPWRLVDYWAMTHDPDLDEYHREPRAEAR